MNFVFLISILCVFSVFCLTLFAMAICERPAPIAFFLKEITSLTIKLFRFELRQCEPSEEND